MFEEVIRATGDASPGPGLGPEPGLGPGPLPLIDYDELRGAGAVIRAGAEERVIRACHDISEGGLGVALSEMTFPGSIGCTVAVPGAYPAGVALFEETPGFVVEVAPEAETAFTALCARHSVAPRFLGTTTSAPSIRVEGVLDMPIERARSRWEQGLREKL